MSRAAEFCYIAENVAIGRYMQATTERHVWWTDTNDNASAEMAIRLTAKGCMSAAERADRGGIRLAFRKVLAA